MALAARRTRYTSSRRGNDQQAALGQHQPRSQAPISARSAAPARSARTAPPVSWRRQRVQTVNCECSHARSLDELFAIVRRVHLRCMEVNAINALHRIAKHSASVSSAASAAIREHELTRVVCRQVSAVRHLIRTSMHLVTSVSQL